MVIGPLWLDWNGALLVGLEKLGVVSSLRQRSQVRTK